MDAQARRYSLTLDKERPAIAAERADPSAPRVLPPDIARDMIPLSRLATGNSRLIQYAWLAEPTRDYAHGVLGDAIEASALRVRTYSDVTHTARPAPGRVFEDNETRIVDLKGNGNASEVIVMESGADGGARMVILSLTPQGLIRWLETPPMGRANRWANPLPSGDYDGDGVMDVGLVAMPHILGEVRLYRWKDLGDKSLKEAFAVKRGYSTHAIGSPIQQLAALYWARDRHGIVLPRFDRRAIALLIHGKNGLEEVAHLDLPGSVMQIIPFIAHQYIVWLDDEPKPLIVNVNVHE